MKKYLVQWSWRSLTASPVIVELPHRVNSFDFRPGINPIDKKETLVEKVAKIEGRDPKDVTIQSFSELV